MQGRANDLNGASRFSRSPARRCLLFALLSAACAVDALLTTAAAGVAATESGVGYAACMARAASTRDMQVCQKATLAEVDARLAVAVAKARAALPADQRAKLDKAEGYWATFRLSDCQVFFGLQSGTLASVQSGECMIDRAEERIKNLRGFRAQ